MNQPTASPRRMHPLVATAAATVIIASLAATAAITGLFPKASSIGAQSDQTQSAQVANQPVVDSSARAPAAAAVTSAQQQTASGQAVEAQQPPQSAPAQTGQPSQYAVQPTPEASQQGQYAVQPAPQGGQPGQYGAQPAPQSSQPSQYAAQPAQNLYAQPGQPYSQQRYSGQQPYSAPPQQPRAAACATCGTVESIVTVRHPGHGTGIGAVGGAVAGGLLGNQFGAGRGRAAMTVLGAVGGGFAGNAVEKHLRSETDYQVRVRMENGRLRYFTYRQAPPFQQGEPVRISHGTLVAR